MIRSRKGELEVITRVPAGAPRAAPLLFVHGAYAGAWCWDEHFLPFFAQAGYVACAVSLRGHGGSAGREYLDALSIADYVADVVETVSEFARPPVLIGHSMGGMVVQKFLERRSAPAAVLMSSVPPQGLMASAVGLAIKKPSLMGELNRLMSGGRVALHALTEALFAQPVAEELLKRYYRMSQPESHRALWDMMLFDLPCPGAVRELPMLILGGEQDALIPAPLVAQTARTYGREAEIFAGMGHALMLERDWVNVAHRIATWLAGKGL